MTAAEELARRRAEPKPLDDAPSPAPEPSHAGIRERLSAGLARFLAAIKRHLIALPRYIAALARRVVAAGARCLAWVRAHREQVRVGLLAALITVCTAGVAYAALSLINDSSSNQASTRQWDAGLARRRDGEHDTRRQRFPQRRKRRRPRRGGHRSPVPGSPAATAGLDPGDVLTQIDGEQVTTPGEVQAALAGLPVGEQVQLQYLQGSIVYMTQATLSKRPAGAP